jgi:hypothetical protein
MTSAGILAANAIGLLLIIWLVNLVRREQLYVGYGVIIVLATIGGLAILSIQPVLDVVNQIGWLASRASGLLVLVVAFVLLMLVYILTQMTLLSNRLTTLTQELAIRDAWARSGATTSAGVRDKGAPGE